MDWWGMNVLGKHFIIELYNCDSEIISEKVAVKERLLKAVELSGATIVETFFHNFPPHGVSGVVIVAESHFTIHTWPELRYAALDIFTCGDHVDSRKALTYLKKSFKAETSAFMELERGPEGPPKIIS